jgi:hypothetical protein
MAKLDVLLEGKRPMPAVGEMDRYLGADTEEIGGAMREVIENGVTSIGGHDVNWGNAVGILIPLGDDRALKSIGERLRTRDSEIDMDVEKCARRSGQLKLIPIVAPYLATEEPADRLPSPPNVDFGGPADRISMVACRIIRGVLQTSNQVDKAVNEWAASVDVPEGGYGREPLREAYRQWWHENEAAIRVGNYAAVKPGKIPVYLEVGGGKSIDEPKDAGMTNSPRIPSPVNIAPTPQQNEEQSARFQMRSALLWSVGVGCLIVCVIVFWYMKTRA